MPGLILNIDVPDIGARIAFYSEAIDVTVGRRIDVGFVELLGAETKVYLLKKATGTASGPPNGDVLRDDTGGTRHPSPPTFQSITFRSPLPEFWPLQQYRKSRLAHPLTNTL